MAFTTRIKTLLITFGIASCSAYSASAVAWTTELTCDIKVSLYKYKTEYGPNIKYCMKPSGCKKGEYSYLSTPKLIGQAAPFERSRLGDLEKSTDYTYKFHIDPVQYDYSDPMAYQTNRKVFYGVERNSKRNAEFYAMNYDASLIMIALGGWPTLFLEDSGRANYVRTARYNGDLCTATPKEYRSSCNYTLISEGKCTPRQLP